MATQPSDPDRITETCPNCERETLHSVRVELVTESSQGENPQFSREPYRMATCEECGAESSQRMNNA